MSRFRKGAAIGLAALGTTALAVAASTSSLATSPSFSGNVPTANPKFGIENNLLGSGLSETSVAWGAIPLANPDTPNGVTYYGYNTSNGGPLTQDPNEAYKTEPDKNVYLVFNGHHYLFQGHEGGPHGYVTRIDLDQPDVSQRVSLVADTTEDGTALPNFDGITWDPFSHQLLLTNESKSAAGNVYAISLDGNGDAVDGKAVALTAFGSGGFEGIQNDGQGNVWVVEDIGGAGVDGGKVPNSYVYKFTPNDKSDLTQGGTMRALQILHKDGTPVTASELQADPTSRIIKQLHTYGTSFAARWVTLHQGLSLFDATASAAADGATPFKRPENGVFRPGTDFHEFYFTETGDTSTASQLPGKYGAVFKVSFPTAAEGTVSPVFVGNKTHTGLDNISFAGADTLLVVEDGGDTLHSQRNALDSGYAIDLRSIGDPNPLRWLAEGRDGSATYDSLGGPDYNEGDNEITGIHTSDGDSTVHGILGAKIPTPFENGWRVFWTQQHGDNITWELHRTS